MNRRLVLAIAGLGLLLVLSGCFGLGGATSEERLAEDADYDWDTDAAATFDLSSGSYTAVLELEEVDELRVYQSTRYGTEHPVGVRAIQFRYENGTVVNSSEIGVRDTRNSVYVTPPEPNGTLAYTASKQSNEFRTPVLVEGDWKVILPEDHRAGNIVLGTIRPGGSSSEMIDDRVHITWDELSSGTVRVNHYLARDLYLFAGLVLSAVVAGAIGVGYVYRQIQSLRRQRADLGLDFDADE